MAKPEPPPLLEVHEIDVYRGSVPALQQVSIHVEEEEIVAVIGANGAGKSTLLRTISGLHAPEAGDIRFRGDSIVGLPPEELVRRGITHAPEGRHVFAQLTVSDNLEMGAYCRRDRDRIAKDRATVLDLFPALRDRQQRRAGSLSGGEQQMLSIGRALMARPQLLLLDEPSLGVSPIIMRDILSKVVQVNSEWGVTVLLVEQNVRLALERAHRGYVLTMGRVEMQAPAVELLTDGRITEHYLGR